VQEVGSEPHRVRPEDPFVHQGYFLDLWPEPHTIHDVTMEIDTRGNLDKCRTIRLEFENAALGHI